MELPEKKAKRIDDLIKSSGSILVVAIVLLCLAPLGMVLMVICFLYHFESKYLLNKYGKELDRSKKKKLKAAAGRYLFIGLFMLLIYTVAVIVFLFSNP